MTQNEMILEILELDGRITPLDAIRELGCMRLSARIYDLRKLGYDIKRRIKTSVNRFGSNVYFAEYYIEKKKCNGL